MRTKIFTFLSSLKLLGFAFGLTILLGSSGFAQNYQNRLVNPGFEDGFNTGWQNWMPDNNVIETDAAKVHGGAKSVALKPVNWSGSGFGQSIKSGFAAGESYTFSAYGKIVGASSGHISIQLIDAGGNKTNFHSAEFAKTGLFEMISLAVAIPEGTVEILPNVWYDNNDGSVLYIDDFSFALSPPNLVANPGFEEGLASWGNWSDNSSWAKDTTANFYSGAKSMRLISPPSGGAGFGQEIPISKFAVGDVLVATCHARWDAGVNKADIFGGCTFGIQVVYGDVKKNYEVLINCVNGDSLYTVTTPPLEPGFTKIYIDGYRWLQLPGKTVYYDDYTLVKIGASVAVTGVSVSPSSASVAVNETKQLVATILPANASNAAVTWSSSNPAIATVSAEGLVKAIAVGTAKITVTTADGNKTAFSDITVKEAQSGQTNLLVNPGFEEASGGYSLWERSAIQTDQVHSGSKAAVVWNLGAPDPGYTGGGLGYEYLAPAVGGTYKLSAYGKLKNDIGNGANIFIQYKDASGAKLGIEQASTFAGKEWSMQSVSAVIPENTAKLVCGIWFDGSGSDSLYMDDFSLVLVSAPQGPTVGTGTSYKPSYINVTGGGEMPDVANGYTCDCDGTGVTDATACLQAALNEAKTQGKPLLIPYTDKYYKISDQLMVDCSVIGVGGMPVIKQTNDKMPNLLVVDDMTGWIYNLHLIGTYDGTPKPLISYEFGHNIAVRGVNGLTISNNILETPQGDNIGDEGGAQNTTRNLLITNNTLKDAWRCGVSAAGVVDRMAIMNNKLYWYSQYVDPIDLEPYQDASKVTNIEVGYNYIESPNPTWLDETHFYEAVLQITAYWDPTPGGNVFAHQNFGNWLAPFSKVTGYMNGPSAWTNILDINNAVGEKIPGSDSQSPLAPKDLAATSVTKTSFGLTWTASTDNTGVVGYLVYKNDSLLGIATASPYNITGLKCGNAYQMAVKAYDADGNTSEAGQANIATLDCGGGVNLLLNPGFEAGLTSWDDWGGTALESTTVRSGANSLKVGTGDGGRAQSVPGLTPGSTYVLSAYGMLTGTGDFYKQSAYIGADIRDAAGTRIDISTSPIIDSVKWAQTTLTFTLPAEAASVTVFAYYEARGITTNSVLTDDWSLVAFTPVSSVTVDPAKVTLAEGIVKQLKVVIAPETASNKEVIWSSSDTTIVSVNSTGMVQAMMVGTAIVTATSKDGGKTSSCEVTVKVPGGNMLQNPGIEKALAVGWTGDWGNNKVLSTSFHSGKSCLAIGMNDGGRAQPFVGFVPGSTYTLSTWGKWEGAGGFSTQAAYIGADMRDAANVRIAIPTAPITDTLQWSQTVLTFTVPLNCASINVYIYLEARGTTTNYVLTDDWGLISGWKALPYIPTSVSSNRMGNFKLYPNPLTGQALTIEGVEGAKSISIYDMTGRLVMNQSLQKANNQSIILNEKLMKGSYIVKIETSAESLSRLLIVQ